MNGVAIRVKGKVQGVGFRPFVWQLAHRMSLCGEVLNDGEGVLIRLFIPLVFGDADSDDSLLSQFQVSLKHELPPLARIETLAISAFNWDKQPDQFSIAVSQSTAMDTQVVPDAATCPACLTELFDSDNRRYLYPLINCTHCGPRFTIIKALPYDRPNTVMDKFALCYACEAEYYEPSDRRYHAQPVACEQCGPQVYGVDTKGKLWQGNWLETSIQLLKEGCIIAVKSVGGFHLICDACNVDAVQRLRDRKHRPSKPFAVMAADIEQACQLGECNAPEKAILTSAIAPIVLVKIRTDSSLVLAANIAPNLTDVGLLLPSNPLQQLIASRFALPLVMTSGNGSGLPPSLDNASALIELSSIADGFVLHNRAIVQRCDDSLLRVDADAVTRVIRRSRGLAPDALNLPDGFPDAQGYLAYGGDLKNAFAVGKGRQIIVSQYIGDLTNIETQRQYTQTIEHYLALYQLHITHHISDKHTGYVSHQYAKSQCQDVHGVQHHHAHIAACLIENGWQPTHGKVLALALDGLGMGDDGELWGGELMIADYLTYQRIGGFPSITLVGGDQAAREPWRSFYAHLKTFVPSMVGDALAELFPGKPLALLERAMEKGLNAHVVRSAGRLFDAVAASLGIAFDRIEYEGQAACMLEALAASCTTPIAPLDIQLCGYDLDFAQFWETWLSQPGSLEQKSLQFHEALAGALAQLVLKAQHEYGIDHLVLTGGVFHNALLLKLVNKALGNDIQLLQHKNYSCGDGGLALGQLAVALCQNQLSNKQPLYLKEER